MAAVLCGLVGALTCAEVGFRALDIRPPPSPPADQVDAFRVRNEASQINGVKLREPAGFPPGRVDGEFRIAVLGDSMTYGEGVESEAAFPRVMHRRLNDSASADGRTWTVVNLGWIGDDTKREAERYRQLADVILPDLLVLVMYVNDFADAAPSPSEALHRIYAIRSAPSALSRVSYLVHYAERKIRLRWAYQETLRYYQADADRGITPEAFEPVAHEVSALCEYARARGTRFAVAMMPWLIRLDDYPLAAMHARVKRFCGEQDIPFLDLAPALAGRDETTLRVSLANHHPSAAAHKLVAEALIEFLKAAHLLDPPPD